MRMGKGDILKTWPLLLQAQQKHILYTVCYITEIYIFMAVLDRDSHLLLKLQQLIMTRLHCDHQSLRNT